MCLLKKKKKYHHIYNTVFSPVKGLKSNSWSSLCILLANMDEKHVELHAGEYILQGNKKVNR